MKEVGPSRIIVGMMLASETTLADRRGFVTRPRAYRLPLGEYTFKVLSSHETAEKAGAKVPWTMAEGQ